jgi:hypothetical protein
MKFNLDFTPNSYFNNLSFEQKIGSKVKGEIRRKVALNKIKTETYPPELVGRRLNSFIREKQGKIHPHLMGGEYLPDMSSDESEICRIVLNSTTMDVISIKAKIENAKINYRVSDEYEDEEIFAYSLKHITSQKPLSMSLLIENIDTCLLNEIYKGKETIYGTGLVHHYLKDCSLHSDRDETYSFVSVESAFYPQLNDYYQKQKLIWVDELFNI